MSYYCNSGIMSVGLAGASPTGNTINGRLCDYLQVTYLGHILIQL